MKKMPTNIIIDVDGVMTSSQFLYSKKGKEYKIFGAHDSDGLNLLKKYFKIEFITADKRGFSITKKRIVNDLKFKLRIIGEHERYTFCKKIGFNNIIYIGDGFYDAKILKKASFGISPKNARIEARKASNYVTPSRSAEGALLDAALKIISHFKIKKLRK